MNSFWQRLGLITHLITEHEIGREEFVRRFKQQVWDQDPGLFFGAFDVFSSSGKEYKGRVNSQGFKIRRVKRMFEMRSNLALATGSFRQREDTLIISTEINGLRGILAPLIMLVLLYVFIIAFVLVNVWNNNLPVFFIPFLLLHGILMLVLPCLIIRRSVARLKYDLEREFHFLSRKTERSKA